MCNYSERSACQRTCTCHHQCHCAVPPGPLRDNVTTGMVVRRSTLPLVMAMDLDPQLGPQVSTMPALNLAEPQLLSSTRLTPDPELLSAQSSNQVKHEHCKRDLRVQTNRSWQEPHRASCPALPQRQWVALELDHEEVQALVPFRHPACWNFRACRVLILRMVQGVVEVGGAMLVSWETNLEGPYYELRHWDLLAIHHACRNPSRQEISSGMSDEYRRGRPRTERGPLGFGFGFAWRSIGRVVQGARAG